MKKILSLLLVACMLMTLFACDNSADPNPTEKPTEKPTEAPTEKPTEPEPTFPDGRIVVQAERPSASVVDVEDRIDVNGIPFSHGGHNHSGRNVSEDGVEYCIRSTTCIIFSAFDSYTYTFEVEKAGTYTFSVLGSCDRDSPLDFEINGKASMGYFERNDYMGYVEVMLNRVELVEGTNTLTITIQENKNHNFWVDCYYFIPKD